MRAQGGTDAVQKLGMIRRDLAEEEGELRRFGDMVFHAVFTSNSGRLLRLSELEYETRNLSRRNGEKEVQLSQLSAELREQQNVLRAAASRVEALQWQVGDVAFYGMSICRLVVVPSCILL